MMAHPDPDASGFLRDTLVFRVGVLSRAAMRAAFADMAMQAVYAAWLSAPPSPDATARTGADDPPEYQTLMEATMEHGGSLVVQARKRPEEFVLTCEHAEFKIIACIAFAPQTAHLNGLHVVTFTGKPRAALKWVEQTANQLQRMLGGSAPPEQARARGIPRDRLN